MEKFKLVMKKPVVKLAARIFVISIIAFIILFFVIGIFYVPDNSMYPMIKNGDFCIYLKLGNVDTGDVIAYENDGKVMISRIVAVPGDEVNLNGYSCVVNGLIESNDVFYSTSAGNEISFPISLGENEYFVLNDYRNNENDSRSYGAITKDQILGKVIFDFRTRDF